MTLPIEPSSLSGSKILEQGKYPLPTPHQPKTRPQKKKTNKKQKYEKKQIKIKKQKNKKKIGFGQNPSICLSSSAPFSIPKTFSSFRLRHNVAIAHDPIDAASSGDITAGGMAERSPAYTHLARLGGSSWLPLRETRAGGPRVNPTGFSHMELKTSDTPSKVGPFVLHPS